MNKTDSTPITPDLLIMEPMTPQEAEHFLELLELQQEIDHLEDQILSM